jgi:tetratricopeptide (TPR) repeat protein
MACFRHIPGLPGRSAPMTARSFALWRFPFLIALLCIPAACSKRPEARVPVPAAQAREEVARGDTYFAVHHLAGWREAEAAYAKAQAMAPSDETRDKLLLTRFLIMTRQIDEDIVDSRVDETVTALCSLPKESRAACLCDLAREYRDGFGATSFKARTEKTQPAPAVFNFDGGVLDAYLKELHRRTYGLEQTNEDAARLWEIYNNSPLFIYLNMGRKTTARVAELEASFPEFAELFSFAAEDLFQKQRYSAARKYFERARTLCPDYTRATNGLANVYFYALEDWDRALELHQAALKQDPANTAAMFGTGASLHHLGKHAESNEWMARTLRSDVSRRGRASAENIAYYQVECNYYLGSNHSALGDKRKAREYIDRAKSMTRFAEHVSYLSAVLHFEADEKSAAQSEFELLMKRGTTFCHTRYYLGRLYYEAGEQSAFDNFLGACSCMQGVIGGYEKQIRSIPTLDVEPDERVVFKGRIEKKLLEYRMESAGLIDAMVKIVAGSDHPKKDFYGGLMTDVLGRIRQTLENRP